MTVTGMIRPKTGLALVTALIIALPPGEAEARGTYRYPKPGSCTAARITLVGARLEGDRFAPPGPGAWDPGTTVCFADGRWMVSYEFSPVVYRWRKGDRVRLCVVELPRGCPPGDHRGIRYRAENLRTRTSWAAIDSEHYCGGA